MQTEGEMLTEDCISGVKCGLRFKTTRIPGKTSRVSWDRGRVCREGLAIIVTAIDVSNFTSSDGFDVKLVF